MLLHLAAGYLAIGTAPSKTAEIAGQPIWAWVVGEATTEQERAVPLSAPLSEPVRTPQEEQPAPIPVVASVAVRTSEPVVVDVRAIAAADAVAPPSLAGPAPAVYQPPPERPPVAFMPSIQARLDDGRVRNDRCPNGRLSSGHEGSTQQQQACNVVTEGMDQPKPNPIE